MEAQVLERIGDRPKPPEPPKYARRIVYVLVDSFDLATIAALRYARSLRPTTLRAVHFVIDTQQAELLREDWSRTDRGVVLDFIDCPDRRVAHCAAELASGEACQPGTHVTVVLPRRSYAPLLGRLLHDRTADQIAGVVSRIPNVTATIVPFDVRSRIEVLHERQVAQAEKAALAGPGTGPSLAEPAHAAADTPAAPTPPAEPAAHGPPAEPASGPAPGDPALAGMHRGRGGTAPASRTPTRTGRPLAAPSSRPRLPGLRRPRRRARRPATAPARATQPGTTRSTTGPPRRPG